MKAYIADPQQAGYMHAATRLLFTETMYVGNEMAAEADGSLGFKHYRFIAVLDLRTSELCQQHDGLKDPDTRKAYTYKNRKPGENFPPLHPWCRSLTAPVEDSSTLEGLTRAAKDPVTGKVVQVPADMTYPEWHKKFVEGNPEAELAGKKIRNAPRDKAQWQRYKEVLGEDAPKTLAEFQTTKYAAGVEWDRLKWDYDFERNYRAKDDSELLTNWTDASNILEKLKNYSLSPTQETGKHKAVVFESALGYNLSNATDLEYEIRKGLARYKAVGTGNDGYGDKYTVVMLVSGPKGKQPIETGWIFRAGEQIPRMVTAYVYRLKRL